MQAAARARYRQRLKDLKAEILSEGDVALEPGRKDAADVGTDEDAQPLGEMSQAIASGRNKNRAAVLDRVVAALKRIDDDPEMFGLCLDCEEPIAAKRLDLLPYVELCVECQQSADGPKGPTGRRHLRDFR
jgi:DnaK suppressor protein